AKEQVSGKQRQVKPLCRRAQNQQAEGAKKRYNQLIYVIKHNAALRGECRINQASADHFHHQNSLQTKNATRHESRLNALLCV
ncbi:hypothetical protein, partial [Vibrio vulnificus]|uniref:hypothetical protein n=1 Tax=Vibrio vulnificus TaxID=672 RepID=UPI003EDB4B94